MKGWGLDVTKKGVIHYYEGNISLCGKANRMFYMNNLIEDENWTPVLGSNCVRCKKVLKNKKWQ